MEVRGYTLPQLSVKTKKRFNKGLSLIWVVNLCLCADGCVDVASLLAGGESEAPGIDSSSSPARFTGAGPSGQQATLGPGQEYEVTSLIVILSTASAFVHVTRQG